MNQLQILRKMTGVKRLEQAFKMSDFTLELAKQNIRESLGKKANPKRIAQELNKRLYKNSPKNYLPKYPHRSNLTPVRP
ncbi:hypothetical protein A3C98_00575 [Candidatus Roizmanbacteria bacterium RIFCSPHIGHO2_02_FULL_37_15]|uniref:Uncharacterized protein n=1 Tax=Candidatus Roizmanbacteria bacterium RIFCSPLOWO2_01_FULL_37_16 TaxID=1802058 RepID=A0A1F7INE7_9BACT|nr:MAG: hypothetical protein A2859_01305 [Candidatus Roizmanbacteria bacterium RIFCSPHIGHO2_01_FULL_37_16b]OGK22774.1 MAG: hypothetical protein A3C98_00575 [Candidatus Roizmanbacteria bacterium RIFCSPHIGHO2_02_FULL_37_15]OGK33496.1 MAG: hypothetical protein A3F57_04280 [Candidatus Roizmanbacteria bacterium RIFCSPHIGHO2_12_FULL_36_11]OGK44914.1 MAG: hypothetical protein A3B40_00085 [Candidatus Roizmanbacteria bacterium RIFCSPLOWO2_01_FULL_37_16]OGK57624.1 MAG: hypothetical protein A3I50_05405 [C